MVKEKNTVKAALSESGGARLRQVRLLKGFRTQEDFAEIFQNPETGECLSREQVSRYERDVTAMPEWFYKALYERFKVNAVWLLSGDGPILLEIPPLPRRLPPPLKSRIATAEFTAEEPPLDRPIEHHQVARIVEPEPAEPTGPQKTVLEIAGLRVTITVEPVPSTKGIP